MLTEYIAAAMATAVFEQLEDQPELYGEIPACPGVWAIGVTEAECSAELQSALEDWLVAKVYFGDDDIPAIAGLSIVLPVAVPA